MQDSLELLKLPADRDAALQEQAARDAADVPVPVTVVLLGKEREQFEKPIAKANGKGGTWPRGAQGPLSGGDLSALAHTRCVRKAWGIMALSDRIPVAGGKLLPSAPRFLEVVFEVLVVDVSISVNGLLDNDGEASERLRLVGIGIQQHPI